jgi:hypothetical protein
MMDSPSMGALTARKGSTCDSFHRHGKFKLIRIFGTIRIIDTNYQNASENLLAAG